MGSPKLSVWVVAISVSYVKAQKKHQKHPCTDSSSPPSSLWFSQTHDSDPENTVVITVGKHINMMGLEKGAVDKKTQRA